MPNRLLGWDALTSRGNPTKSIEVNNLIKSMKQDEVRQLGKALCARRALSKTKFRFLICLLETLPKFEGKHRYTFMIKQQFNFIVRGNDICHLEREGLCHHSTFEFALSQIVFWSKNVMEERDCPPQIMLGSMDPDWCTLLGSVMYLEPCCGVGNGKHSRYLYAEGNTEADSTKLKNRYSRKMAKLFSSREFQDLAVLLKGPLGVHSLRKFAAQWARKNGCTMDDIEIRGRWKAASGGNRRVVGRYIDPEQEYIDTKVCASLCVDGPIWYRLKEDTNLSKAWIRENVVPGIAGAFPPDNNIADVLGTVLLWANFDPQQRQKLPQYIKDRIDIAYAAVRRLDEDVNPVDRVPLEVYRVAEEVRQCVYVSVAFPKQSSNPCSIFAGYYYTSGRTGRRQPAEPTDAWWGGCRWRRRSCESRADVPDC